MLLSTISLLIVAELLFSTLPRPSCAAVTLCGLAPLLVCVDRLLLPSTTSLSRSCNALLIVPLSVMIPPVKSPRFGLASARNQSSVLKPMMLVPNLFRAASSLVLSGLSVSGVLSTLPSPTSAAVTPCGLDV